ncbi:MAG: glutaredoxin 3 [Rhizobiales bacterium]|nr:glutaredoxin 3 [Hyphomicrobiales bacterium]
MADVTIYTRAMCGYCSAAKAMLERKNVDFTEHDATFDPDLRREMMQRAQGASTFPQIFFGDMHIGGFDEMNALERAGKLDALLKAA